MGHRSLVSMGVVTILVAVAAVLFVGTAEAAEVLTNPGFESGAFSPWTTDGTWTIETNNCHSGSYCASDVGNYYIQQTFPGTPTDSISSITFWMRQPQSGASMVLLFYTDSTSSYFNNLYPTASWTKYDVTSALVPGKTLNRMQIWGYIGLPAPDVTVLDDVSIQTREAIPMLGWRGLLALALALGAAGAILVRRRLA